MQKTMKAAVVRAFGKPLAIEEIRFPEPRPGEVLVKVIACGVCHTDLHAADGDWPTKPHLPFVPGHEITGVVAALGPGVTSLREGDPVGVAWLHDALPSLRILRHGMETLSSINTTPATAATAVSPNMSSPTSSSRPSCRKCRLRPHGAHPLRRRDDLQGTEGDGGEARRMDRHFRRRRPR